MKILFTFATMGQDVVFGNLLKSPRSKDGLERSTEIRVMSNDYKNTVKLRRPLQLLVPTEVSGNIGVAEPDVPMNNRNCQSESLKQHRFSC